MIQSAEEFVRLRLSQDRAEYLRAAHESASDEVWLEVINNYPEMREWVAHNKTTPRTILEFLSNDSDPKVRHTVSSRRSAGEDILNKLAFDSSELVRLSVARNPKVTEKILLKLLDDELDYLVEVAKEKLKKIKQSIN